MAQQGLQGDSPDGTPDGSGNIVLIGMRASGKTTLGRELSRLLGMAFVDLDDELGRRAGRDVDALLVELGEAAFRDQEREVIEWASTLRHHVVATGGGAPLHGPAFARLARTGRVVYLEQATGTLVARGRDRPRPPLTGGPPEVEVARIQEERATLYRNAAQITVPAEVGDSILAHLQALATPIGN